MGTKTVNAGDDGLTYSPTTLTDGVTAVTITYTDGGASATTTTPVTVTHALTSIAITTQPTKTSYEYGDTFATAGMVVRATYSDNSTATVTPTSVSPANGATLSTLGTQTVTVTYTDASVTALGGSAKTATTSISVARKSVSKPTWKSSAAPTYSGSNINVASSTYWNNWSTTYYTNSGCSASGAGTHTATFTPGSNYRWSDGSTSAINVDWTIKQKAPTFSVNPTSIALNASNYSTGVSATITYDGDGTLSAVSGNTSVATVTGSGTKNLTIKGINNSAGSTTITISATAGTNYSKPNNISISVTATYWKWGDETAVGDATWWANLKSRAAAMSATERSNLVGKTKKVSLSSAVQGANYALVRCIGADQDGTGTLTFQTAGTLPTNTAFGSNALWASSTAKTLCEDFATKCSASASIKTVTKLTSTVQNGNQTNSADGQTECKGWLPSDCEMGFPSGGDYNNGKGYSSSYSEWTSGGSQTAYKYYDSNEKRIKYAMDANGNVGTSARGYWERSRYYSYANSVCYVYTDGKPNSSGYSDSRGLAPAFTIG